MKLESEVKEVFVSQNMYFLRVNIVRHRRRRRRRKLVGKSNCFILLIKKKFEFFLRLLILNT
jgi:hypothetical protein